mgnify:FL=1
MSCAGGPSYDMGSTHRGTNANTGTYGGVFRLRLDSRTRHGIRDRETREMKQKYQVIMTKIYEVKVEAESREEAEEIFDNFGDWEELLRVHTLDIEPEDTRVLREEN